MKVSIYNNQKDLKILKKEIKRQVEFILKKEKISCDLISINFVDEKKIRYLHKKFFNIDTPTDCISFPIDSPSSKIFPLFLGEVFICPKIAIRYAKKNNLDPFLETYLYLIHSILHLIGYNDVKKKEKIIMKKKEKIYMQLLKTKLPKISKNVTG